METTPDVYQLMNKQNVLCPCNGILFSQKNEMQSYALPLGDNIMLNERSQLLY